MKITPEEQAEFDNLCDDILAMAAALYDKVGQLDQYADNADAFSKDQTPEKENQIGLAVALNVIRGFIADTGEYEFLHNFVGTIRHQLMAYKIGSAMSEAMNKQMEENKVVDEWPEEIVA